MEDTRRKFPYKMVAHNGAVVASAAVFAYSLLVMLYVIVRTSVSICNIMPRAETRSILFANGVSVAYAVAIFSLLAAAISALGGAAATLILQKSLRYFNPRSNLRKAILISAIEAFAMLTVMYITVYPFLHKFMTFDYAETFVFWFLLPSAIFVTAFVISGITINNKSVAGH
jgi:hypothetical protein